LAYENARRVRFIPQPKSKAGDSGTVLVALYRQGEEGSGKPADVFMRRIVAPSKGNPYAFTAFLPGAQNVSSVTPTVTFQDPFDATKPVKMLRWSWTEDNLNDASAAYARDDAMADRGALNGDDLIIAYSWTPNWGRNANDKYDLFVRRSFDGGQTWTTDSDGGVVEHSVAYRVPIVDYETQTVAWDEEVVTTAYNPGDSEPPRNVSNLRNNRTSVLEPRLVKTPGTILTDGYPLYLEDVQDTSVYQVAYGLEFNQNQEPNDAVFPKMPLDIYYSRTADKGQHYEEVIVTPQDGGGKPEVGWNPLAKDKPQQGAAQIRQTPDGSRMYAVWLEESESGSDIMFRRVDYR
ncbi:MAG TPA: sialidase family protein, partial [Candidatus Sulfomarinibacteraceae bacterium]|nr:sialidase family protein [Candidatus Sulfomarinibacteraceae bacterium]